MDITRHRFTSRLHRAITAVLFFGLVLSLASPANAARRNSGSRSVNPQLSSLLDRMTPEERVGQLFLVTFKGLDVGSESKIYELVTRYHIGGVVLLASNDNFIDSGNSNTETVDQAYAMIRQIQQTDWTNSRTQQTNLVTGEDFSPQFIPLFVAIAQEGNGLPYDQILNGLTPLPNAMALGATWKPELAEQVGAVLGKELSILGINLLLGPSIDVLETPQIEITNNLGARTFGGDPFWVGEMGRAYIRGVHSGGSGRVAVAAKHFPGHGSSDRLPEEEVATVLKSLDELESFDLAPFFKVTGNAVAPEEVADALLVSHIRYQGLQGNIRATTRPVSLDPQAFNLLMSLPALESWKNNGGIMISDDLGSQAVRRFYDLTSQTFDARRVAVNAFLAGNDLLYFSDFSSTEDIDPDSSVFRTLEFFAQKYREDPAFAERVDQSVLRILNLKSRIYSNFNLGNVINTLGSLEEMGTFGQFTFEVARDSATLISPGRQELDETVPDPPNLNDRIVFVTDVRSSTQCSQCPVIPILDKRTLQDAITRLYGSQAGGQVTPSAMSSYTIQDLLAMLDGTLPDLPLENELRRSNWIIFAMLSARQDNQSFTVLSRFLSERPDLFLQKRLIIFTFSEPYFLDATNISKLTAYYGLYDASPPFIDVAAYLLFKELPPAGSLPVSVAGISYNLNEALFPDPGRVIQLILDTPDIESLAETGTPEPSAIPQYHLGDTIPVRTGVILDHNGHPVPDGTPVTFIMSTGLEATTVRQVANTLNGISRTQFLVSASGTLEVFAESERARSISLNFDIPLPSGEFATVTETIPPTSTTEPSATPEIISPTPVSPAEMPPPDLGLGEWLIAVFLSAVAALGTYRLSALFGQVRWGVRASFFAFIGGLISYSYLALKLPGTQTFWENSLSWSAFIFSLGGALGGIVIAISWRWISEGGRKLRLDAEEELSPSAHQSDNQAQEHEPSRNPE